MSDEWDYDHLSPEMIRENTAEMFEGRAGRPRIEHTQDEFDRVCEITRIFRERQHGLCESINNGVITRGEFYDSVNELSDRMFDQMLALLGTERYTAIFDSPETQIRWCSREEFIHMEP